MSRKKQRGGGRNRLLVIETAARIVIDEGVRDYRAAKLKAMDRLGLSSNKDQPSNLEIEQAVYSLTQIFQTDEQRAVLQNMRTAAVEMMRYFEVYHPRLVGPVLKGTANELSIIQLHLFSDEVKTIAIKLLDDKVAYESIERRKRKEKDGESFVPGFAFMWGEHDVEVLVFPFDGIRKSVPSQVEGKMLKRASITEVESLLL